ncbi:MAG: DsbA family protein, partial [Microgenomates group bacterium]
MKNVPLLIGTLLISLVLVLAIAVMFGGTQGADSTASDSVDQGILVTDARHFQGPEDAPITIVVFSDFECPACKATEPLIKQVVADFDGSIRYVYRHFPLDSIHPNARAASEASEVAASFDKFWEFHDKLFEAQEEWSKISNNDDLQEKFAEYAEELEIDKEAFIEKMEDESVADAVTADVVAGSQASVNAT